MATISEHIESLPTGGNGITKTHDIEFKGTTEEYFGIWIVNVLLSIVTLGVYSAWAKVRNKKYFSGVTFIDGHNFDYHATGVQILIGRLIVFGFYIALLVANLYSPELYLVLILILFAVLGWIIRQALRFNARMTSYRNVRFNFEGSAGGAWLRYVLLPLLVYVGFFLGVLVSVLGSNDLGALTGQKPIAPSIKLVLGIMGITIIFASLLVIPYVSRAINRYSINNHRYGDRQFGFDAPIGPYYVGFLKMIGLVILVLFGFGMVVGSIVATTQMTSTGAPGAGTITLFTILYPLFLFGFVAAGLVYRVAIRNIIFNNSVLDERHQFISTFETPKYAFIIITNVLAVVFSLGLAVPWTRIRLARYVAENTKVVAKGSLGGYTSSVIETSGVSAAEYADIEGFDIDIGIGF